MAIENKNASIGMQGGDNHGTVINNFYLKIPSMLNAVYLVVFLMVAFLCYYLFFNTERSAKVTQSSGVKKVSQPINGSSKTDPLSERSSEIKNAGAQMEPKPSAAILSTSAAPEEDQTEVIYEDSTGAQAYFNNDDGSLKKIVATGEAELTTGDSKDRRLALLKASIRAKASIAKFLNETIKSHERVEEIIKTISKSGVIVSREIIENQIEVIEVRSNEILKGIVTLQQSIDTKKMRVTVTVGMKQATTEVATDFKHQINQQ